MPICSPAAIGRLVAYSLTPSVAIATGELLAVPVKLPSAFLRTTRSRQWLAGLPNPLRRKRVTVPAQGAVIVCPGMVLVTKVQGRSAGDAKPQVPELRVLWATLAPIVTSAEMAGARATAITRQAPAVSAARRDPLPRPKLMLATRSLRLEARRRSGWRRGSQAASVTREPIRRCPPRR